jgi:hypothetical protein
VSGYFHTFAETVQAPLMFNQFGETVHISKVDEDGAFSRESNDKYQATGIIRVIASESKGKTGQTFILKAEVLLRYQSELDHENVNELRSNQVIGFRGQTFRIEALGEISSGFRKVICVATKQEFTSAVGGF